MNYSYYHKKFAGRLNFYHNINEQDVLDFPEQYLGPNYKEVLNSWFYLVYWDEKLWNGYWDAYFKLAKQIRSYGYNISTKLASEVIDPRFVVYLEGESCEIIAAHLYLQRNIPFTFLPLIFDL
jgi:hypothetical protein